MNKINLKQLVHEELDRILGRVREEDNDEQSSEAPKSTNTVSFNNITYKFETGVNRNPTKLGIKLQFTPLQGLDPNDPEQRQKQDALLQKFLNQKFQGYGKPSFVVDFDSDVPNPSTTGFLIRLGLIESLVDSFFKPTTNASTQNTNNRTDSARNEPDQE
jgi:hypothetical protein